MYHYNLWHFEEIVEECEGCEYVFERITDNQKSCRCSFTPKREWFWFKELNIPCARATHVKKNK